MGEEKTIETMTMVSLGQEQMQTDELKTESMSVQETSPAQTVTDDPDSRKRSDGKKPGIIGGIAVTLIVLMVGTAFIIHPPTGWQGC